MTPHLIMEKRQGNNMDENLDKPGREELKAWVKQHLDTAVRELTGKDIFESLLVEAKPAWVFPFRVLIGKVREQGQPREFQWFICGDVPTDHVNSGVASTPRDVARHFALKWQLDAARQQEDPGGGELAEQAEALYELVDQSGLWPQ